MAVAHDASSESALEANVASQTWQHVPVGTPKGVLVFVITMLGYVSSLVTSITYGGQALTFVPGSRARDTASEPGASEAWFLGAGIPTGEQTVVLNRTNTTNPIWGVCITVTAGQNTEINEAGIVLLQESQSLVEQNVDDGSPGTNSVRYAGLYSGYGAAAPPGANSTALQDVAGPSNTLWGVVVRETTAGQGSRPVGFSLGTFDDTAATHLAVREAAATSNIKSVNSVLRANIGKINSVSWANVKKVNSVTNT